MEITAHFAGTAQHGETVDVFHEQVSCEASMVATVDWSCHFPDMYACVAKHLALHTALVSRAQAHVLNLYVTGFENIPDPLDDTQHEVHIMHALSLVTDFELVWHIAKFEQERSEVAREHHLLCECAAAKAPQLGTHRPSVWVRSLILVFAAIHTPTTCRALLFSKVFEPDSDASSKSSDSKPSQVFKESGLGEWVDPVDPTEA